MSTKFDKAVGFVFEVEGYESNYMWDKGGYTKYGISQKAHPDVDVFNLTKEAAKDIYKVRYWDACGCENLPAALGLAVFDTAVNHGQAKALKWLEYSNGDYTDLLLLRLEHYAAICNANKTQKQFLLGWVNRLVKLRKAADALAGEP